MSDQGLEDHDPDFEGPRGSGWVTTDPERNRRRFANGADENRVFWSRMGEKPDFTGASVLEIGSGWGSLAVEIALAGASRVVGLDLKPGLVDFANEHVRKAFPRLAEKVRFFCLHLKELPERDFDFVVTKDTFEHIIDLEDMLREMETRLRPGGRIYTGFGPLYTSPYGDHSRRAVSFASWGFRGTVLTKLPWAHLFLEKVIVREYNRREGKSARSMLDMGLSKRSLRDYQKAFRESGLDVVKFLKNRGGGRFAGLFRALSRIPLLENYCTYNVYCILERRRDS